MSLIALLLCHTFLTGAGAAGTEPEDGKNAIYEAVRTTGLEADGTTVRLAEPLLRDGMSREEQRATLLKLAESTKNLEDLLEPSITAPFKTKLHDWQGTNGTIRGYDIYFVVHAKLDEINLDDIDSQSKKGANGDIGNMHFEGRLLDDDELKTLGLARAGNLDQFNQIECTLLDKVEAKTTNRSLISRSEKSLVVATQPVRKLPGDGTSRNVWRAVERRAGKLSYGPWQPFAGAIVYTKITQLDFCRGALFVEIHGASSEPKGWFNGRGILKSKISLVANEKIRDLRRQIAKQHEKAAGPAS